MTDILIGVLLAGEDLTFIKQRFSPTVREAILKNDANVSPRDRLQLFLQFTGLMSKLVGAKRPVRPEYAWCC